MQSKRRTHAYTRPEAAASPFGAHCVPATIGRASIVYESTSERTIRTDISELLGYRLVRRRGHILFGSYSAYTIRHLLFACYSTYYLAAIWAYSRGLMIFNYF